ncbi:CPS-53 (KpLE1) prophage protein [Escherichia coli]
MLHVFSGAKGYKRHTDAVITAQRFTNHLLAFTVNQAIERRAYEIALLSLEVEPDEREAYELFMEKRFGGLVDRRRAKNGDNEYMAWDMTLGWIVWQQRAGIHFSTMSQQEVK